MGVLKVVKSLALIVLLVTLFYAFAHSITSYTGFFILEGDSFSNCLESNEVVLYVDFVDMSELESILAYEYLEYVKVNNCSFNRIGCAREGVSKYPSWSVNKVLIENDLSIFELADLTECEMV